MGIDKRDYPLRWITGIVGGTWKEDRLQLECGHEKWVLVSRAPRHRMRCTQCGKRAPAVDPGASTESPASEARSSRA